jgi:hypothetical protein
MPKLFPTSLSLLLLLTSKWEKEYENEMEITHYVLYRPSCWSIKSKYSTSTQVHAGMTSLGDQKGNENIVNSSGVCAGQCRVHPRRATENLK